MEINQAQTQKLTQELRLTPQQILQSAILQLNVIALEARVSQELEQNPVLEESEEDIDTQDLELDANSERENEEVDEIDWEEILPQNDDYKPREEFDPNVERKILPQASPRGLVDYMLEQVRLLNFDNKEEEIAKEIIWNIDDRGYLTIPIENIAQMLGVNQKEVEKILKQIQSLDPPGIAARDLRECLLLQLNQMENADDAITIVRDHFDDFANKRFQKIMKDLGCNEKQLQSAQEVILKLNPKPGLSLTAEGNNYIVPDLIVERVGDDFIVEVNDAFIPDLRINEQYIDMVNKDDSVTPKVKLYLKRKIDSAKWFIQAIQQRRVTMIRVMKAIIKRQPQFFIEGKKRLKPMILKDIAEDVNMDISTVSRVTNGKYVQLSDGIYELKSFFSEGMRDSTGEEVSTNVIKEKLKQIIDSEDKHKPYSDEQLSNLLKEEGYPIARRTVTKYREQLKIPVARLRRGV
jgi:RNA polymerase sigma-54 factor